jgi:copper oxidase (laccase) domain-containing protein
VTPASTPAPAPADVASDIRRGGEIVESFADLGVEAFTTGRAVGSFGMQTGDPVRDVTARWSALRAHLGGPAARLATAYQVHGSTILEHVAARDVADPGWQGFLRAPDADGHVSLGRGTAMAVTVADCVPVLLAHPSGAAAALHSGWRGTAARITERAIARFAALGCPPGELRLHCGPAICGRCYEVSSAVYAQLTGRGGGRPALRAPPPPPPPPAPPPPPPHDRRPPGSDCRPCPSGRRAAHLGQPPVHPLRQRAVLLASGRRRGTAAGRDLRPAALTPSRRDVAPAWNPPPAGRHRATIARAAGTDASRHRPASDGVSPRHA